MLGLAGGPYRVAAEESGRIKGLVQAAARSSEVLDGGACSLLVFDEVSHVSRHRPSIAS